jgi:hypothetical protein
MKSGLVRRLAVAAVAVAAMLAAASPAWAETFTVTNTGDSGPESLRQAIADANATTTADTITFASDVRGAITLASTLMVTNPLTIEGPGAQALTISGNNTVRPLSVQATTLNISGLTIADGRVPDPNSDIQANYGGAIFNYNGTLTIRGSALTNNGGFAAYRGGAIYNLAGTVSLIDSSVSGYQAIYGGAIYNFSALFSKASATLTGSTLSGNFALDGGAIYNPDFSKVHLTDGSRLEGNGAVRGGGIYNASNADGFFGEAVRITGSTVVGNFTVDKGGFGGGVYTTGDIVVERSTFSGNEASNRGGGLFADSGDVKVDASTFSGNRARGNRAGGGIGIWGGSATITNSTLSGNSVTDGGGGGVYVSDLATTAPTIRGSIIAGNTAVSGPPNVEGNYTNGGFNIVGGSAAEAGLQTDAQGNPVLSDNGGSTRTVALVRGSKAIDAGNSFGSTTDQRGTPRPKDYASADNAQGGDGSDIGAFEYVDPDASAPTVEARPTPLPDAGGLNNSDVTVAMSATDEAAGSGVWRVSYSASGAQQVPEQNVPGTAAELVVSVEGETIVTYWATDRAGNRSESKTLTVRLDKAPPDTSIVTGPSGPTKNASASFGFSSDDPNATFECKLDGGAFEACSSPKDYSALNEGNHALEVRATDAAGNVDPTPASRSWNVDTAPPGTSIASGPSGIVRSASASFRFSSPEAGARFECKLDRGVFIPCASPKSYSALSNGKHAFSVRARDAAGNVDATPAARSWTVDRVLPTVSGMSPRNASTTADTSPTIRAIVRDNLTNLQKANIKLYVNGVLISPTKYSYNASTDALVYNSPKVAKGKKTVRVVATDAAKNVRSTSWYFTIR